MLIVLLPVESFTFEYTVYPILYNISNPHPIKNNNPPYINTFPKNCPTEVSVKNLPPTYINSIGNPIKSKGTAKQPIVFLYINLPIFILFHTDFKILVPANIQ